MLKEKWDKRFLILAQMIAQWSKDPSTKVGAVITHGKRIVSLGFNGFAAGINDLNSRYKNRDFKLAAIIHAENNAIMYAHEDLHDCTIYTWPMPPCSKCAAQIIQVGINRIVSIEPTQAQENRWRKSFNISQAMYNDVGIDIVFYSI